MRSFRVARPNAARTQAVRRAGPGMLGWLKALLWLHGQLGPLILNT